MDTEAAREQALAAAREQALDAAEELFYARGIQTVGMDDIRGASGVSLKRLYQLFPAKELLVEAYLKRRDVRWRQRLAEHVDGYEEPEQRILAVFEWLGRWFAEPDFRGCAWINSYGELGATSPRVVTQVRAHKGAFKAYLGGLERRGTSRRRHRPAVPAGRGCHGHRGHHTRHGAGRAGARGGTCAHRGPAAIGRPLGGDGRREPVVPAERSSAPVGRSSALGDGDGAHRAGPRGLGPMGRRRRPHGRATAR